MQQRPPLAIVKVLHLFVLHFVGVECAAAADSFVLVPVVVFVIFVLDLVPTS